MAKAAAATPAAPTANAICPPTAANLEPIEPPRTSASLAAVPTPLMAPTACADSAVMRTCRRSVNPTESVLGARGDGAFDHAQIAVGEVLAKLARGERVGRQA